MDAICIAIRSTGIQCDKRRRRLGDGLRCGCHENIIRRYGPHTTARKELNYIHKKEYKDFVKNHETIRNVEIERGAEIGTIRNLDLNFRADIGVLLARHRRALTDLSLRQRDEINTTGVDPDEPARERQRIVEHRRVAEIAARMNDIRRELQNNANPQPPAPIRLGGRQLAQFAADPQNVHTTEAVRQTKDIVEHVRKIPVPEGYRWNTSIVSKTIGEIITECQLTAHAAAQMFNQYVSSVSVYDIEPGIYGKVLDSVWQYVKNSPDKADLCVIIKSEMEDNIGMCAQGNLSRICNVLAGILEGVGSQESLSERLGRLFGPLLEIDDHRDRIARGINILQENHVPSDEWSVWMEPLNEIEA